MPPPGIKNMNVGLKVCQNAWSESSFLSVNMGSVPMNPWGRIRQLFCHRNKFGDLPRCGAIGHLSDGGLFVTPPPRQLGGYGIASHNNSHRVCHASPFGLTNQLTPCHSMTLVTHPLRIAHTRSVFQILACAHMVRRLSLAA